MAAVNAVITGVFAGLGLAVATPLPITATASASVFLVVGSFASAFLDQERRWRRSDASEPTRFLPDGTPAMQVSEVKSKVSGSTHARVTT